MEWEVVSVRGPTTEEQIIYGSLAGLAGIILGVIFIGLRDWWHSRRAKKWADELMAEQDREIAAHMISEHNRECKEYRRNRG